MSLFTEGINPEWEDEHNKKGKIFTLDYIIDKDIEDFLIRVKEVWTHLLLSIIGERYEIAPYVSSLFLFYSSTELDSLIKLILLLEKK